MKPLTKRQILKRLAKGKNFSGAFLKYAELRECDLFQANFFRADLEGADLEGADCGRAQFLEANLEGANLVDALCSEAYFEDANLYRADLESSDLRRADLKGANLRDANLARTCLERVDLERVQAAGATFSQALLYKADLTKANLSFCHAEDALFIGATMTEALLKGGDFRNCNFSGANLENADFENADLRGALFSSANLAGVLMDGCRLDRCVIDKGNYPGMSARWIDLSLDGDGSERYEFRDREISGLFRQASGIVIELDGALPTAALMGLTRFMVLMETLLPDFRAGVDTVTTGLQRTRLILDTSRSVMSSVFTFCFFLIYQFANGETIDCGVLEELIIRHKSPVLAALLVKRRPLSTDIVKQILKMKKILKADSLFFQSRLVRFRLMSGRDSALIMARIGEPGGTPYQHRLVVEEKNLL